MSGDCGRMWEEESGERGGEREKGVMVVRILRCGVEGEGGGILGYWNVVCVSVSMMGQGDWKLIYKKVSYNSLET